ncbi:hypothetical protein [Streptomyces sp. NBC_00299]|uniref:hypothetical protein n=1 Tax=Streptomyces sp. NBC_00299 TaxID=2975705 RepID=UPI002E2C8A61|nr:hypothetical protein [Streptomyces sp. NBC_00299]
MSAVAAEAAALSELIGNSLGNAAPVRRQRVRVPMRLVSSPYYQDVALSVYVKVKALGLRPEGCQAKSSTIASYLGLSKASVERGLALLSRPAPDGVIELTSERRTLPGGRGLSALRSVRTMTRTEAFVWVPVAAAEDLTPRQLRVYMLIAFAQARGIALTEAELAVGLRHHSGQKAGQPISVTAASAVVDEVEAARWVTVQRRAGAQGRHRYIAHDIAPEARPDGGSATVAGAAVTSGSQEWVSSPVGEGSGSPVGEGSLANEDSPRTDSPDDARALVLPAVGEVPVVEGAEAVENPAAATARKADGGLALRAGGNSRPAPSKPETEKRSKRGGGSARSSYDGPQLAMSPQIYAVLEPVHVLLERVHNDFVVRQLAREVGRQLREGTDAERLHHRLTARFAKVMLSEIRDPGRWLLGVALPRWGCGYQDCEAGVLWSTGKACEVCAEIVQDKAAALRRAQRIEEGLCPEHGTRPGSAGRCADCVLDDAVRNAVPVPAQRELEGPPRGSCGDCGARIVVVGRALEDGLCKLCREQAAVLGAAVASASLAASAGLETCSGRGGTVPCGRKPLPSRSVCGIHRVQELASEVA